MRVLMITSEWPTPENPQFAPFIVQEVNYLRQAGIEIEIYSFRGRKNPVNYLKAWLNVRRTFDVKKFDLIHAQFGHSALIAVPAPIPLVISFRGSDLLGIAGANGRYTVTGRVLRLLSRWVARRADNNIVVAAHLLTHLPAHVPVRVIPGGIDLDLFHPIKRLDARQQLGLPRDKTLVLFAANPHNHVKRYHLAKNAVDLLRKTFSVELIVVMDAPHNMMPAYMNACDALLLTSSHEGSPAVVKEALACNLAVVSVDVGDVREHIGSVPGCFVCAEHSPESLAEGLAQALRNPQPIRGRDSVMHLDERISVQNIIKVYHDAMDGTREHRRHRA